MPPIIGSTTSVNCALTNQSENTLVFQPIRSEGNAWLKRAFPRLPRVARFSLAHGSICASFDSPVNPYVLSLQQSSKTYLDSLMRVQTRNLHCQRKREPFLSSGLVQTFQIIIDFTEIKKSLLVGISPIVYHQPDIHLQERTYSQLHLEKKAYRLTQLQLNLSSTAILGTEESSRCREVAVIGGRGVILHLFIVFFFFWGGGGQFFQKKS